MVPEFPGKSLSAYKNCLTAADKLDLAQIMEKDPEQPNGPIHTSLVEIGPRFVMTPIKIFEGAFNGATVFSNPGAPVPSHAGLIADVMFD